MDENTAHAFGRVEAKLDRISDKQDRHAEMLAEHAVRLGRAERDIDEIRAANTADVQQGMSVRGAITVAVAGAVASGVIGVVIQAINAR